MATRVPSSNMGLSGRGHHAVRFRLRPLESYVGVHYHLSFNDFDVVGAQRRRVLEAEAGKIFAGAGEFAAVAWAVEPKMLRLVGHRELHMGADLGYGQKAVRQADEEELSGWDPGHRTDR